MRKVAILVGFLTCLAVGVQAAPIFQDGFNFTGTVPSYVNMPSGTLDGVWTIGGGGIDWVGSYWKAEEGNGSIDLSGKTTAGSITTTLVDTVAGQHYTLTFWLAGNFDPSNSALPKNVQVDVGNATDTFTFPGGGTTGNMGWIEETVNFTASGNDTLMFTSLEQSPYGPALDNVSVSWAVPEPASMLMAGLGLLTVGGLLRFRKRVRK